MNKLEFVFLLTAETLIIFYLRKRFKALAAIVLLSVATLPALYFSLERTSQFLTSDESYMIHEPLNLAGSDMLQWTQRALRTTDAVSGLLAEAAKLLLNPSDVQSMMLAKCFHWLIGFALILWIHALLDTIFVPRTHSLYYFLVYIYLGLLLPVSATALKVFNYDMLSMLLGTLACLYIVLSLRTRSAFYGAIAVAIAYLAAQEKLLASPILICSLASYRIVFLKNTGRRSTFLSFFWGALGGITIAVLTGMITAFIVSFLRGWAFLGPAMASLLDPMISWAAPIIQFTMGSNVYAVGAVILLPITVLILLLMAAAFQRCALFLEGNPFLRGWHGSLSVALLTMAGLTGVGGTFLVSAFLAPFRPIASGHYQPTSSMDGIVWHFGASSLPGHIARFIAFSYAVFANSVPSVYWLCLAITLLFVLLTRRSYEGLLEADVMIVCSALLPLAFGVTQTPVGSRYLNIAVFLAMIMLTLRVGQVLSTLPSWQQAAYAVVVSALLCIEVLPFGPLYAPFRPLWSNYSKVYNSQPVMGQINPWWIGWGEEVMLAGQRIRTIRDRLLATGSTASPQAIAPITLYYGYPGVWLDKPRWINTSTLTGAYRYSSNEYFVLNRSAIIQRLCIFPTTAQPDFVIGFRGYTQAWVFRGDRLAVPVLRTKVRRMEVELQWMKGNPREASAGHQVLIGVTSFDAGLVPPSGSSSPEQDRRTLVLSWINNTGVMVSEEEFTLALDKLRPGQSHVHALFTTAPSTAGEYLIKAHLSNESPETLQGDHRQWPRWSPAGYLEERIYIR